MIAANVGPCSFKIDSRARGYTVCYIQSPSKLSFDKIIYGLNIIPENNDFNKTEIKSLSVAEMKVCEMKVFFFMPGNE